MKKPPRVALVASGKITDLPLVRSAAFMARLGPVKAPSFRVASRIANTLRAGHAVGSYEEIDGAGTVIISLPDQTVSKEVLAMSSAERRWEAVTVILYSYNLGISALQPLASAGATTASVTAVPGFDQNWFLLEVDKTLVRQLREFLPARARVTVIPPSSKADFLTAMNGLSLGVKPLLNSAASSLKHAGISRADAAEMMELAISRTIRKAFARARS
jgi:hypothetical protein